MGGPFLNRVVLTCSVMAPCRPRIRQISSNYAEVFLSSGSPCGRPPVASMVEKLGAKAREKKKNF